MKKKRKIIYGIILILIVILIVIWENRQSDEKNIMTDLVNQDIGYARELLEKNNIELEIKYEYSYEYEKDKIISQSISKDSEIKEGERIILTVSLGKIDIEKLAIDQVDELGKVPIMMYHGIENIMNSDTKYTGGNVDKDGYTRTAEAFRNDLEKFYQKGYRMIKLSDYIDGKIDVEYGYSPLILTFDDGNSNNIKVTGRDSDGNIIIDGNSAVGIMEEYKKKYPDYNITAIFFVTDTLFNQPEYNEEILHWLIDNGYEVGNHTKGHNNFSKIDTVKTQEVVGYMYNKLESILGDKYERIVALPFGSPYNLEHENYPYIINGEYEGKKYNTVAALRVGWEPEVSPFNKDFDKTFLKRCRAYDNEGREFDIEMILSMLDSSRYISDGNIDTIVTKSSKEELINKDTDKEIILY